MKEKFFTTKNLTVAATLTAISYVLYMFAKFPLPFMFPGWLDMQFSDLPALIGGFMMGPIWGSIIIVIKCLLKMPFTSTACVGELADIIVGIAFVLPSALIYKKHRTKKGALAGLGVGMATAVFASVLANAFILIPFFTKAFGWKAILGMVSSLFPSVSERNFLLYYLPLSVLPFNILRCVVCALITFLVYKHLHKLINKMFATGVHKEKNVGETAETACTCNADNSKCENIPDLNKNAPK